MAASESLLNSNFDEKEWVVQIEGMLGRDLEEAISIPPSIFLLPDSITRGKPEDYVPTRVALGPYHHFRPDLYHMEIYKLDKAKTARIAFELPDDYSLLVNELRRRELKIRASFRKYIAVEGQTLALMMAIDGLYLLWLLEKAIVMKENTRFTLEEKKRVELFKKDYATERDALLLENQIPVEVLKGILAGKESHEKKIFSLLFNYCSLISPFDLPSIDSNKDLLLSSHHLLHFLYNLVISLKSSDSCESDYYFGVADYVEFLVKCLGVLASIFNISFLQQLTDLIGLLDLLKSGRNLFSSEEKPDPLVPSASKLAIAGVRIEPTTFEGLKGTSFSNENKGEPYTLKLPLITVNSFSEVVLRNLVAFELTSTVGPLFLTRYIGLMSGLVETGKDVQLLVRKKIIRNDLGSDEEVVKLFNGIWSSTVSHLDSSSDELGEEDDELGNTQLWERGLLEVPRKEIEGQSEPLISKSIAGKRIRVIEDINQFYEGLWRVKTKKFLKKYVFSVLKILLLVALVAIGALVILRTACSFFSCPKILKSS